MDLGPRKSAACTLDWAGGERRFVVEGVSKSATWYWGRAPLEADDMVNALLWFC
jgi:hypothetical protein